DTIAGGPGSDSIDAGDGVNDTVDCGDGWDLVRADTIDALSACEGVTLVDAPAPPPPPVTPPAPPAPTPASPTHGSTPAPAAFAPMVLGPVTLTMPRPTLGDGAASSVPVTVSCAADGPARCRGDVRITVTLRPASKPTAHAARVHGKTITLAHGRFSVARGRTAKANAKVWRRGVRQTLDDAKQQGATK